MHKLIIFIIGISLISCNQSKRGNPKTDGNFLESTEITENFDWLIGEWKRSYEDPGRETFERWEKKSNIEYLGLGFTMQNGDTLKKEKIRLIKVNNNWDLEVQTQDEAKPVTFKMTSFNDQEFICENKDLDFPNKIKYWKNKDKMNASVSGEGMEIPFEFDRIK